MRHFVALMTVAATALLASPVVKAQGFAAASDGADPSAAVADQADEAVSDGAALDDADAPAADVGVVLQHFNRWVCVARGITIRQVYSGYSAWFAAGSGQGQAAHQTAYQNALNACHAGPLARFCHSDFANDCSVQRI